jgi:hypothetical protein
MRLLLHHIKKSVFYMLRQSWIPVLVVTLPCSLVAAQENYLDQLEVESKKLTDRPVLAPGTDVAGSNGAEATSRQEDFNTEGKSTVASPDFDEDLTMADFEDELKVRFLGSFTFYKKLPQRSREEVYRGYLNGNTIEEIRKMIMSRYLHSR